MVHKKQRCIICESQDIDKIAKYFIKFNGDLIPVCEFHNGVLKKHSRDIIDEQSGIKGDN